MRKAKRTTSAACILAVWVAGGPVCFARGQQLPTEVLKASYAKLSETTHRVKRYPPDAVDHPHIEDVVPRGLTRATVAIRVIGLGDIRFEEVWLRNRRGERIVAPSADVLRTRMRAASSMAAARDLLNSVLTGLLSASRAGYFGAGPLAESLDGLVGNVRRASDLAALHTQADVLEVTLNHWVCGGNPPGSSLSIDLPTADTEVGPALIRGRATTKYLRQVHLTEGSPLRRFVYIEGTSGLPIREEDLDDRDRVTWVTEYVDIGASITIDTPDCLTPRGTHNLPLADPGRTYRRHAV